jgi:hypothetical protein
MKPYLFPVFNFHRAQAEMESLNLFDPNPDLRTYCTALHFECVSIPSKPTT